MAKRNKIESQTDDKAPNAIADGKPKNIKTETSPAQKNLTERKRGVRSKSAGVPQPEAAEISNVKDKAPIPKTKVKTSKAETGTVKTEKAPPKPKAKNLNEIKAPMPKAEAPKAEAPKAEAPKSQEVKKNQRQERRPKAQSGLGIKPLKHGPSKKEIQHAPEEKIRVRPNKTEQPKSVGTEKTFDIQGEASNTQKQGLPETSPNNRKHDKFNQRRFKPNRPAENRAEGYKAGESKHAPQSSDYTKQTSQKHAGPALQEIKHQDIKQQETKPIVQAPVENKPVQPVIKTEKIQFKSVKPESGKQPVPVKTEPAAKLPVPEREPLKLVLKKKPDVEAPAGDIAKPELKSEKIDFKAGEPPHHHNRGNRFKHKKPAHGTVLPETVLPEPEVKIEKIEFSQDMPESEQAQPRKKEKKRRSWKERNEKRKQKRLELALERQALEKLESEKTEAEKLMEEKAGILPRPEEELPQALHDSEVVRQVRNQQEAPVKREPHTKHETRAKHEVSPKHEARAKHEQTDKPAKRRPDQKKYAKPFEKPEQIPSVIESAPEAEKIPEIEKIPDVQKAQEKKKLNLKKKTQPPKAPKEFIEPVEPEPEITFVPVRRKKKNDYYETNSDFPINKEKLLTRKESLETIYHRLFRDIENNMKNNMLVDEGVQIVLGISGGVDSVVMLDIMAHIAARNRLELIVAHYNHNLRGEESDKDEEFVRSLADSYNIRYFTSSGKVRQFSEKNKISLEAAGRILRYKFFERVAQSVKANFVATAHNADDTAETMLLNLFRGSGLTGLSGIPAKRVLNKNIKIIRPLIDIRKSKLIEYASKRGLAWREDSSNVSKDFTRNKIRNELLPSLKQDYNPSIVDTITRAARLIHGADEFVRIYVKKSLENVISIRTADMFSINIPYFETFSDFIQGEIIQYSLHKFLNAPILTMNAIDRILDLKRSDTGSVYNIDTNYVAVRDRNELTFARSEEVPDINETISREGEFLIGNMKLKLQEINPKEIRFTKNPKVEYFDAALIPKELEVRNWKAGDYFQPYGMDGTIKVGDFLTNYKVSLLNRKKVIVLKTKDDVIWLIGHRISDKFKVTELTKKVLKAELVEP